MKYLRIFCVSVLVCSAAGAFAQAATPNAQAKKTAPPKGVKTFAEEVRHVAATNYLLWGALRMNGIIPPASRGNQ
jgi:hypothetical protein